MSSFIEEKVEKTKDKNMTENRIDNLFNMLTTPLIIIN